MVCFYTASYYEFVKVQIIMKKVVIIILAAVLCDVNK